MWVVRRVCSRRLTRRRADDSRGPVTHHHARNHGASGGAGSSRVRASVQPAPMLFILALESRRGECG